MYNCLRFCQRFLSPFTLETIDQGLRHNGRIVRKYCNSISSTFKESPRIIVKESVTNFDELLSYLRYLRKPQAGQISQLFTAIKEDNLTEQQVLLLLECCSNSIPNENIETKHYLCETVLNRFLKGGRFSEKVYEFYINICTENNQCLDPKTLISSFGDNITPNLLKVILHNACECAEIDKALTILAEMKKKKYNLDEDIFNHLVLAHTIEGGHSSGLNIMQSMRKANLKESNNTLFFIIKGLAGRKNSEEFTEALKQYKISYTEDMVLSLLKSLGFSENHAWAKTVKNSIDRSSFSRYFKTKLEKLCINLVQNGKYDSALEIYKVFQEVELDSSNYGGVILKEMLLCSAPIDKIVQFAKDLTNSGFNKYALENVTESALRNKMFVPALNLLGHMSTLKPHYFWPILIEAHSRQGEKGLQEIVQIASDMNVKFDSESFEQFILPRCDLEDPQRVIKMFQEIGYTVRTLLTPMIIVLLRRREMSVALELCEKYKEVKLVAGNISPTLSIAWLVTANHNGCLTLLQNISESQSEVYLGQFLIGILEKMSNKKQLSFFVELLQEFRKRNLKIDSGTADSLTGLIDRESNSPELIEEVNNAINDIIDFSKSPTIQPCLHPVNLFRNVQRDMTVEQLEVHLIELKGKGMETRGVLRRLIQRYAGQGNPQRVKELRDELTTRCYGTSPGIKSALMHSHVQEGDLEGALEMMDDLIQTCPRFRMDAFKMIDLARLLVIKGMFDKALDILKMSSGQKDAMKTWQRNCVNLLKSIKNIDQQKIMFKVLVDYGYCEPTNILLGTIVQLHLEQDTLENTIDLYVSFCNKYEKTPMQVVLMAEALAAGKEELLQKVVDASALIHGDASARYSLIAAMCEKGMSKQVAKVLQDCKTNLSVEIEKRCERWVHTNNMNALETLLAATKELPPRMLDIAKIQLAIMRLYSKRKDCDGALAFWKQLVDEADYVDAEVDNEFCELLNRCKFNSPENLNMKYKLM